LEFETQIQSDSAALHTLVVDILGVSNDIRCMRDPTRGGVSSALNEIAERSRVGIEIDELSLPIHEQVRGACELLGLDPLYVANEGRFVAFVPEAQVTKALDVLQSHGVSQGAVAIGKVNAATGGMVIIKSSIGAERILDLLSGEQLPRIC